METEAIMKGNALIAAFMGGEFERKPDHFEPDRYHETFTFIGGQGNWLMRNEKERCVYLTAQLQYHAQWDWIMPVYDKIRAFVAIMFSHERQYYQTAWLFMRRGLGDAKIDALWLAIVGFINAYNIQKKP